VIAAGGLWFNSQQRARELRIDAQQREREQDIVQQRAQDEAVQAYLNHIGELLLDEDKPLRQSIEGDKPRTLARARTLTVLRRLDGERKCSVVTFLYEAALISKDHLILNLRHSDLSGVNLAMTNLGGVNLSVALGPPK
jgi:uncharacterized protein YjbI with pentapeptide repeats